MNASPRSVAPASAPRLAETRLETRAIPGPRLLVPESTPLKLDCGVAYGPITIAYQTYGTLNAQRSNAILVCHALTGDQFVASEHPVTGKPGWWELMVGPGLPLDTDRYFIICSNVLGGCMGTKIGRAHV